MCKDDDKITFQNSEKASYKSRSYFIFEAASDPGAVIKAALKKSMDGCTQVVFKVSYE